MFVLAGTLLAGKGGKKPPKDEPPAPNISFSMTLLGTLGGSSSEAWAMNEWGDVVGKSKTADGTWAPFVYFSDSEEMVDLRDFLTQDDLDLWRWDLFAPRDINSGLAGRPKQICGGALKSETLQGYAIRITLPQQVGGTAPGATGVSPVLLDLISSFSGVSSVQAVCCQIALARGQWHPARVARPAPRGRVPFGCGEGRGQTRRPYSFVKPRQSATPAL